MMTVKQMNYSKSLQDLFDDDLDTDVAITGLAIDSRLVKEGDLFLAYKGTTQNGADYIDDAIKAGAIAIAVDKDEVIETNDFSVVVIKVSNLKHQVGYIAGRFYDQPSSNINVIGVTGTNGKTSVSYMVAHALSLLGQQTALIGTLGYGQYKNIESGHTTTPDPVKLQNLFCEWRERVDSVAMEVSSHALDQGRVVGTWFNTAIFTNLSRDHLDYHNSLNEYASAKFQLFHMPELKHAIININDEFGLKLIDELQENIELVVYSINEDEIQSVNKDCRYITAVQIHTDQFNTRIKIKSSWGEGEINSSLLGQFNIENLLAACAALCVSDISIENACNALSGFSGIPGRMESFHVDEKPFVVVDYAHTPDALEKALTALRPYCSGDLYCVFGCGGDRDKGKRPEMGAIAEMHADKIVITDDNPRSEDPAQIVKDILTGINNQVNTEVIHDRSAAITNAFLQANKEDVILIAGKGHEVTQQIGSQTLPFSDRELARRLTGGEV